MNGCRLLAGLFVVLLCRTASVPTAVQAEDIIVRASHLHTGTGDILSPGTVRIRDGRIVEVAESIETDEATVVNVETLIPGLVDASATTGLSGRDAERTEEFTPDVSTLLLTDWRDRGFQEALAQGTTSLHLVPGTQNVIAGTACVVKSAPGSASRVVAARTGLFASICDDPTSGNGSRSRPDSIYIRQPTNRMGVIWMMRQALSRAATADDGMAELQQVLAGNLPLFCVSRTGHDMRAVLTVAEEFGFRPTIVGGHEAWQCVEELSANEVAVVLQRNIPWTADGREGTRTCAETAQRLAAAGVEFCFSEGDLLDQARFAVRYGLDEAAALQAITSAPARILNVDERVGRIAVGNDADLVALNGPPLEFTTAIDWVMVDGVIHDEQETGR